MRDYKGNNKWFSGHVTGRGVRRDTPPQSEMSRGYRVEVEKVQTELQTEFQFMVQTKMKDDKFMISSQNFLPWEKLWLV